MTRPEFLSAVYLRATGKPTAPTSGRKYDQILALGTFYTRQWQDENDVDWDSLFDFFNVSGTVTATDEFTIPATVRKVSQQEGDVVRIVRTDGDVTEYQLVAPDRLYENRYGYAVAKIGSQLKFASAFTATSREFGGTIVVPGYGFAVFPTDDSTAIPVDNADWLVVRVAAEFVRTDITRQNQYPNLLNEANQLMLKMRENNSGRSDEIYRPTFLLDDQEW